jgi:hypothetical protein
MARFADDNVLDDGLDSLKAAVDAVAGTMVVCEGQPTTYSHASQNKGTGDGMVLATVVNPTITIADDTSGRKATISAESGVTIDVSGNADHVALTDGTSVLWFVTTATLNALVAGGLVDIPAWKINVKDPTAPV